MLSMAERAQLRAAFTDLLGNVVAESAMTAYPDGPDDLPVSRSEFRATSAELRGEMSDLRSEVRATSAELRGEMADLRSELKTEMADLRSELKTDMAGLRSELKTEIGDLRDETRTGFAEVRVEMANLELRLEQKITAVSRTHLTTMVGLQLTTIATVVALVVAK